MPDNPGFLSTIIIRTGRMGELAAFYSRGLGLGDPKATGDDHLGFTLSNLYFGFDQAEETPSSPGPISIWFDVDDIETVFERFKALGAGVKYPPERKPWGGYLAALYDPDGNLFGLAQAPSP